MSGEYGYAEDTSLKTHDRLRLSFFSGFNVWNFCNDTNRECTFGCGSGEEEWWTVFVTNVLVQRELY